MHTARAGQPAAARLRRQGGQTRVGWTGLAARDAEEVPRRQEAEAGGRRRSQQQLLELARRQRTGEQQHRRAGAVGHRFYIESAAGDRLGVRAP